jgi:hypothetical protein
VRGCAAYCTQVLCPHGSGLHDLRNGFHRGRRRGRGASLLQNPLLLSDARLQTWWGEGSRQTLAGRPKHPTLWKCDGYECEDYSEFLICKGSRDDSVQQNICLYANRRSIGLRGACFADTRQHQVTLHGDGFTKPNHTPPLLLPLPSLPSLTPLYKGPPYPTYHQK